MASHDVAVRPRRSAFAAAFLSFVFPGLGHAYLGRWLRALLWAIVPVISIAGIAGIALSPDRAEIAAGLVTEATPILAVLALDSIYRLLAMLDAYRLARDPSVGSAGTRMLSVVGLAALVLVLVGSHVVVAQPILLVNDTINQITENSDDNSEIADLNALAARNPAFALIGERTPAPSKRPRGGSSTSQPNLPVLVPDQAPGQLADPAAVDDGSTDDSQDVEWNGKDRLNILLIGADGGRQGRANSSYLTDTMIVVSIDPPTGRVAFISLPRDTAGIPLPRNWPAYRALGGKYNNKINTLYTVARGRADLFPCPKAGQRGYCALMGALGQLYGLNIKYYVAVELNSFRSVVNTLGGVVIDVQLPVQDNGYPTSDGRGKLKLYIPPGMSRMNGQHALAYARSRHGSSDFDRAARQQAVITSVRNQTDLSSLLKPGVIDRLIKDIKSDVRTNIPPKMVPKLVALAQNVDLERRENLVLSSVNGFSSVCYPCGPSGLWMLKANTAKIKNAVQNIFSNTKKQARTIQRIRDEGAVVHVLNGKGGSNAKAVNIADALSQKQGFSAVVPPLAGGKADSNDYKHTVIIAFNGAETSMPQTIKKLKSVFKDKGAELLTVNDPSADADVVVIVGKRTRALKP